MLGQALGGTTLAVMQGALFLVFAPFAGIHLGLDAIAAAIVVMSLVAFALTSLGLVIAWRMESTQGFHAIMNLILMPIWFLSGAVFPRLGRAERARLGHAREPADLRYGGAASRRSMRAMRRR